ncbi:MAG: AMP-dependent synthetase and ligase [Nocardioidaceae bacterium]|nr:AMP-dependent synthetase and ligase [Nocardioidaceae bacterium]
MESNVAQLLRLAAESEPDRIALSEASTGRTVTWRALDEMADAVATGLATAGLVAGHRMMLVLGNRIEFVAAYLGALRARVVVVPVNPRSAVGELVRMIADSGSRVVVADADTVDDARAAVTGLAEVSDAERPAPRIVGVGVRVEDGETTWDELVAATGRPTPLPDDPEALAVLLYTSGTSGRPRAAMLSHRALLANIEQVAAVDPPMIHGNDVVFGVLPLFHVYGLNAVLGQTLKHCARLVLVESFHPEGALDIIEDEAITVLPVAPPVFAYWRTLDNLKDRIGPVRLALSGSAPLATELIDWFTEATGVALHQGYGLTEASPVVTSTLCSKDLQSGSVGAALPGVDVRLVDDQGAEPDGDDPGEIWVRGENLFSGYWPDGDDGPGAEGWYATGDVGFLDQSGDLFLVDRLKELVIVSGFNVYPSEVEEVIAEVAQVAEVAVIGVADDRTGEAVVAYVKATDPSDAAELPDLVRDHCTARLARFKQPSVIHVVAELPYTVTGKVQKGRLRATERRRALGLLE